MALNFPDSPTLNQVYRDTTSGFSYEWNGTVWISYSASASKNISILDDISGSFNGSTDTFPITVSAIALTPANAQQLRIVLGGVVQDPVDDYTVSGSDITFTTPPAGGLSFSGVSLGPAVAVSVPGDGTVAPAKLSSGGPSWNSGGDVNVVGVVTATNFVSTSDENLKENIQTIDHALEKLSSIRGVSFDWKKDQTPSMGVIAQEVEKILPSLVMTSEFKAVNYDGIIGVLIEAVKELQQKVYELEKKI